MHNLPKLNQEEIESPNRPITSKDTKVVIKKKPPNQGPDGFMAEFY